MTTRGLHRRHHRTGGTLASLLRLAVASTVLVGALVLALGGSSYAVPAAHCHPAPAGVLEVAPAGTSPLVWYDAENPPPALTNQISEIAMHLYPGRSGTMVAYVRNTGVACGTPSIAIGDLVDSGVLSSNIRVTITYTSSLAPGTAHTVAAGTLRELAASGLSYAAPVKLGIYARKCANVGTWAIRVEVPTSAGNEIQGDWCTCSVRFGLTGCVE